MSRENMGSKQLNDFTYLIDLKPVGLENFIASYVLKGTKVAIVETGPTATVNNLLMGLQEFKVKPEEVDYVVVSHIHPDHGGGAGALLSHLPNAKIVVHPRGVPHLVDPSKLWSQAKQVLGVVAEIYGVIKPVPLDRIISASDNMVLDLGEGVELKVLETLGHAAHHLSFYEKRSGTVFSGDAAGIYFPQFDRTIPTTPPPLHLEMTFSSIDRLVGVSPKRICYTHFGMAEDAVRRLKAYAEQLRLWAKIIVEGMKRGEDIESLYKRISEEDPSVGVVAEFIRNHLVLERGVVRQAIQGFMEYFEKHGFQ
jgi:glyoxylase-like metal-dependent hydrolase (beta-lactamase superfamily II)